MSNNNNLIKAKQVKNEGDIMIEQSISYYVGRVEKVEENKNKLKYVFDKGRFVCNIRVERIDHRFDCYIMKVETNYGYVIDKNSRLLDRTVENADYMIKKYFIKAILGIT